MKLFFGIFFLLISFFSFAKNGTKDISDLTEQEIEEIAIEYTRLTYNDFSSYSSPVPETINLDTITYCDLAVRQFMFHMRSSTARMLKTIQPDLSSSSKNTLVEELNNNLVKLAGVNGGLRSRSFVTYRCPTTNEMAIEILNLKY